MPAYWQDVIKGVLIVAAVAVDVWSTQEANLTSAIATPQQFHRRNCNEKRENR